MTASTIRPQAMIESQIAIESAADARAASGVPVPTSHDTTEE